MQARGPDGIGAHELSTALVPQEAGARLLADLEAAGLATAVSLDLPHDLPFERFEALCAYFGSLSHATRWWIGDLILWGDGRYQHRVEQAANLFGLAEGTLQNYASVCDRVPAKRRKYGVPFHVHAMAARMEPDQQERWLTEAAEKGWTTREFRAALDAAGAAPPPRPQPEWTSTKIAEPLTAPQQRPGGEGAAAAPPGALPRPELAVIEGGVRPTYPVVLSQLRDIAEAMIERAKKDNLPSSAERWELERDALSWALEQLAPELA